MAAHEEQVTEGTRHFIADHVRATELSDLREGWESLQAAVHSLPVVEALHGGTFAQVVFRGGTSNFSRRSHDVNGALVGLEGVESTVFVRALIGLDLLGRKLGVPRAVGGALVDWYSQVPQEELAELIDTYFVVVRETIRLPGRKKAAISSSPVNIRVDRPPKHLWQNEEAHSPARVKTMLTALGGAARALAGER